MRANLLRVCQLNLPGHARHVHNVHMTEQSHSPPTRKAAAQRMLAVLGSAAVVVTAMALIYAALPDSSFLHPSWIAVEIVFSLAVYAGLVVVLFARIKSADRLNFVGILLLVILITFFVLSFSWLYRQIEAADPGSFSEPLSAMSAVYFTIAILSTVGFGDIRPLTDPTRAIVTAQMVLGVGLLAATISLVAKTTRYITKTPPSPYESGADQDLSTPGQPDEKPQTAD